MFEPKCGSSSYLFYVGLWQQHVKATPMMGPVKPLKQTSSVRKASRAMAAPLQNSEQKLVLQLQLNLLWLAIVTVSNQLLS